MPLVNTMPVTLYDVITQPALNPAISAFQIFTFCRAIGIAKAAYSAQLSTFVRLNSVDLGTSTYQMPPANFTVTINYGLAFLAYSFTFVDSLYHYFVENCVFIDRV